MEILAGRTHYYTLRIGTGGLGKASFTIYLFKDGNVSAQTINLVESKSGYYTFSFANDGTDRSQWCLIIVYSGTTYSQAWTVRKPTIEKNIALQTTRTLEQGILTSVNNQIKS
jgi:hypothetical protein